MRKGKPNPIIRVRRLALTAMLAEGGLPRPEQFRRAGLPPLYRASDLLLAGDVEGEAEPAETREYRANRKRRLAHPGF